MLAVDLDQNGFVDTIRRRPGGFSRIDLVRCDAAACLVVRLTQPGANPDALGALVVTWPDGAVQRFADLPTRGFVEVVRSPLDRGGRVSSRDSAG